MTLLIGGSSCFAADFCHQSHLNDQQYYFQFTDAHYQSHTAYFIGLDECKKNLANIYQVSQRFCGCQLSINKIFVSTIILADAPFTASLYCYDINSRGEVNKTEINKWGWEALNTSTADNIQSCENQRKALL